MNRKDVSSPHRAYLLKVGIFPRVEQWRTIELTM
jgi:hypothetical protein